MTDNGADFKTFAEFWPSYLGQHRKRLTRTCHIVGTILAVACLGLAIVTFNFIWFLLSPFFGYGIAWATHVVVEKNHPATFTYPLWSLRADLQMVGLWLTGRLELELIHHNILT
jgi:hypothetical protein